MQSVLDLRIMRKDCKKEAKDFKNSIEELAYTAAQVSHSFRHKHLQRQSVLHIPDGRPQHFRHI